MKMAHPLRHTPLATAILLMMTSASASEAFGTQVIEEDIVDVPKRTGTDPLDALTIIGNTPGAEEDVPKSKRRKRGEVTLDTPAIIVKTHQAATTRHERGKTSVAGLTATFH